jgi:hypothetical protein
MKEGDKVTQEELSAMLEQGMVKEIDNSPGYYIHRDGYVISSKTLSVRRTFLSNRGYKRVGIPSNKHGKNINTSLHTLVANAFLDKPTSASKSSLTINHKDGDKLNNNADNLEWSTMSENIKHAHSTGLHPIDNAVEVYDIKEDFTHTYHSLKEFSNYCKIPIPTIIPYIGRPDKYPMLKRFIINLKYPERVFNYRVKDSKPVYVYDHVTNTYDTLLAAEHIGYKYGLNQGHIGKMLRSNNEFYIGGLTASYNKKFKVDKSITREQAIQDREAIWKKPILEMCTGLVILPYGKDEEIKFINAKDALIKLKLDDPSKSRSLLAAVDRGRKNKRPGLFLGNVIRRSCDNYELKGAYTDKERELSYNGKPTDGYILTIDGVKYYSLVDASRVLGITPVVIKDKIVKNTLKDYGIGIGVTIDVVK